MKWTWRVAEVGLLLVLIGVWLTGCASAPADESFTLEPGADECPVLVVENQNFADVVVYLEENGSRITRAHGLATTIVKMCRYDRPMAVVGMHAIGGAFSGVLRNQGTPQFERGGVYHLLIAGYAPSSYLYGSD